MSKESLFVLAIALLTWCGIFLYLLRLDIRTRALEKKLRDE